MNRFLNSIARNCGKPLGSLALVALFAGQTLAHFLYLVPAREPGKIQMILSENLNPETQIAVGNVNSLKLTARAYGQDRAMITIKSKHCVAAQVPDGTSLIYGTVVYGLMSRGERSSLLVYHPKLLLGSGSEPVVGDSTDLEVVAHQQGNRTRFQLLYEGNPVAGAEGSIHLPDGKKEKLKTDQDGFTEAFAGKGRYGLWMRHILDKSGELSGKNYADEKHYATLVGELSSSDPELAPLPAAVSSMGAAVAEGQLYVYGGHYGIGTRHTTQTVTGDFRRLELTEGKVWESLPGGPPVEGVSLVAYKGTIIRIGGMKPRNDPGQPEDHLSLASCARFDPKANRWDELPPLPAGRSSHDAVVVGDKIVVVGGWQLKGGDNEPIWHDTTLILDMAQTPLQWRAVSQPFKRRALTAAAVAQQVFVMCGLDECGGLHNRVDILDLETLKWSEGPEVPGDQVGYGSAAAAWNGRLVFNSFDGPIYSFEQATNGWQKIGRCGRPRMVHRLVPHTNGVLLVGGSTPSGNIPELEYVAPAEVSGIRVILGDQIK